jgi:ABC-2 type transport system permease protein
MASELDLSDSKKEFFLIRIFRNFISSLTSGIKKDSFILRMLLSRDFKLKYRRSVLGVAWSILNPLLMMVVISAVFSHVFRFDIPYFAVYLILGITMFNLMGNSTSAGVMSIISSASLIKKIRINKLVFPVETVLFELLNFALSLVAVMLVVAFYCIFPDSNVTALNPLTPNLLFLPLLIFYVLLFCMGLSFLLSALAVFFRDIVHLWGVVIIAWTYATPLFYPYDALAPWMQSVMSFNPMYHFITYFRGVVMHGINPGLLENLLCLGVAVFTLIIGVLVFRKTERKFILHV